jgi:hypothetical protein
MNNTERPPSDDLQKGESDPAFPHPQINTSHPSFKFKVWYVDKEMKDKSTIIVAQNQFQARHEVVTTYNDVAYVVNVDKGAEVKFSDES